LAQVRSGFYCSGQVRHLCFGLGIGKFPLKITNFSIFSLPVKKLFGPVQKVTRSKTGGPLIYCGSKVCSGQVGSGPYSSLN